MLLCLWQCSVTHTQAVYSKTHRFNQQQIFLRIIFPLFRINHLKNLKVNPSTDIHSFTMMPQLHQFLLLSGRSVKTKVFHDFSGRWSKVTSEIDNKIYLIKVDIDKVICYVIGDPEVAGSSSQCDILHAASEAVVHPNG